MIDNRIYTFLELCNEMNYHRTAEKLNMTQPAVTQHIKHLENLYGCKLFEYNNKRLNITEKGRLLEMSARSVVAMSLSAERSLNAGEKVEIRVGATKTIGEYAMEQMFFELIQNQKYEINLIIDNTERLLERLNHFKLDILLIEGYIDKNRYDYRSISNEEIVGICAPSHPFAGKELELSDVIKEIVLIREHGSGTRAVFENFLNAQGFSVDSIKKKASVSSNKLIEKAVENNLAVSFVYDIVPRNNKNISVFRIKGHRIFHEFNYVFLKNASTELTVNFIDNIGPHLMGL